MQHRPYEPNRHFRTEAQNEQDRNSRDRFGYVDESDREVRRMEESRRLEGHNDRDRLEGMGLGEDRGWQPRFQDRWRQGGNQQRLSSYEDDGYGFGFIRGARVPNRTDVGLEGGRYEPRFDVGRFGVEPGRFEGRYEQGRAYDPSRWTFDQGRFEQGRYDRYDQGRYDPRFEQGRFDQQRFEPGRFEPGRFEQGRAELGRFEPGRQGGDVAVRPRIGRGPKGYRRSDERIKEDVCDRIAALDVDASNVEVEVSNGEVTLSGFVPERSLKYLIEQSIERVGGVTEIGNTLRVKNGAEPRGRNGSAERSDDGGKKQK
ncbi:MAG: BON domain-containing protein [Deltaproteobacteria bacterium]|nr:BON domain-containing protein [Deltaproteobacteria bacterium]